MTKSFGIYIHVPFCKKKCLYCDFYTAGERIANWEVYIECLINELISRKNEIFGVPSTLYIGGGTPSLIPPEFVEKLVNKINQVFNKSEWDEFTIEANPEDINESKLKSWLKSGINRVSMGIQTLEDSELNIIGRRHNSESALKAVEMLKRYFDNISLDIMFGIPGQTLKTYESTLKKIIDLNPSHISSYSLMIEQGTALWKLVELNEIQLPKEDEWLKMFQTTTEMLKENGYNRYEISNYSLPDKESKHNSSYWHGNPYLGLGPGAHSYDGEKIRRANPNDVKGYIKYFTEPLIIRPFYIEESLSEEELREEYLMTRLRTTRGLSLTEFENKFGKQQKNILLHRALAHISKCNVKKENDRLFFTDNGFIISDSILADLI